MEDAKRIRVLQGIINRMGKEKPFYASKKAVVTLLGCLVGVVHELGYISLEGGSFLSASFVAYVISQGLADLGKNKEKG